MFFHGCDWYRDTSTVFKGVDIETHKYVYIYIYIHTYNDLHNVG